MQKRTRTGAVWLFIFVTVHTQTTWLWAASPIEEVRSTVQRVLEILKYPKFQGEVNKKQRRAELQQAIQPRFDFDEMARRSLGNHWKRHAARSNEFIPIFTDFVEKSYVANIESFKNEKILYIRERLDNNFAQVDTKVVTSRGDEIPINYKLHTIGGEWKIYDVVIENVSLVNNYRSQFNRILSTASFDELLKKLQEKRQESGS